MPEWHTTKPPNEVVVEVRDGGVIRRVRAIWGRDGMFPHWEAEDGSTKWASTTFTEWRRTDA